MTPFKRTKQLPTIAWCTDTHAKAGQYSDVLQNQLAWVRDHRVDRNIQAFVHTGDLVAGSGDWSMLYGLTGIFPPQYMVSAMTWGNHDATSGNWGYPLPSGAFNDTHLPSGSEVYASGSANNAWAPVTLGGVQWAILSLEYGARDEVLVWAQSVLANHSTIPTILITHAWLYSDGTRYDKTKIPAQLYGPPFGNDAEEIWSALIYDAGNVAVVLCGHSIYNVFNVLSSPRSQSAMFPVCHQIVSNFQEYSDQAAGNPFMNLVSFDKAERGGKIFVEVFSPPSLRGEYITSRWSGVL